MKITKNKDNFGLTVNVEEDKDIFGITFGGNLDLYWYIHSNEEIKDKHKVFRITKENYKLYELFEILYRDIERINLFDEELSDEEKDRFREYDNSNYKELFNPKDKTITWYSDETAKRVGNYLVIKKKDDSFELNFHTQNHIDGYDRDFNNAYYIPIRFRNSGSRYTPFNCVFMRMYNRLDEIDDVNDMCHQLHMEEYLYHLDHPKVFVKK